MSSHICLSYKYQTALSEYNTDCLLHLHYNLDMVDFAAHCTIHAIKIGFQKYYILSGKCCP